jgi:hypothetical protein
VLRVGGNFTQTHSPITGSGSTFIASGTHRVVLNGTSAQTVSFTQPQTSTLHHLEIDNPAGVVISTTVPATGSLLLQRGTVSGSGTLTVHGALTTLAGSTLAPATVRVGSSMAVAGVFTPVATDFFGPASTIQGGLAYQHVAVTGTATVAGPTVMTGGLTVGQNATLVLGGQAVTVGGGLDVQGLLRMTNATDELSVAGAATFRSGPSTAGALTAGVLRVGGNFTQTHSPITGSGSTFIASGTHRVVLNGTSAQTVSFTQPQTSTLHHLEIDNPAGITVLGSLLPIRGSLDLLQGSLSVGANQTIDIDLDLILRSGTTLNNLGVVKYGRTLTNQGATLTGNPPVNAP